MMGYEGLAPKKGVAYDRWRDDRLEWVHSDCKNKLCTEGGVHIDDGQYSTFFRCPMCNRSDVFAPEYTGQVEYWTDEEMATRLKDRKDIYFDKDLRYKRGKEVMGLLSSLTFKKIEKVVIEEEPF
jgi:hypothetical protein